MRAQGSCPRSVPKAALLWEREPKSRNHRPPTAAIVVFVIEGREEDLFGHGRAGMKHG